MLDIMWHFIIVQVHFILVVVAARYLGCSCLNYFQITYNGHTQLYRYMNIMLDIVLPETYFIYAEFGELTSSLFILLFIILMIAITCDLSCLL